MAESTQPEPGFDGDSERDNDIPLDRDLFVDNCILALQLFVVGERSAPVLFHIDRCAMCSALIHGKPGTPLKTSILEDLEHRMIIKVAEAKNEGRVPPSREVLEHGLSEELKESRVGFKEMEVVVKEGLSGGPESAAAPSNRRLRKKFEPNPADRSFPAPQTISRRNWIKVASLAVVVGSVAIAWQFRGEAQRSPTSANTGYTNDHVRLRMLSRYDGIYRGSNTAAIQNLLANAPVDEVADVIEWIAERRIVGLYPDIIVCANDIRVDIRRHAVAHLMLIPAIDLKPHLSSLQSTRAAETNIGIQKGLDRLIKRVTNS